MLWWGCLLSVQGHDVCCDMQACLVYLELILIAQYIFQIPTHLHCKAVSDTTQVCDPCVRACVLALVHAYVCLCVHIVQIPTHLHCRAVSDVTQVCAHLCMHACVCACVCACVRACVHACMCL